jgi:hypothetical protein
MILVKFLASRPLSVMISPTGESADLSEIQDIERDIRALLVGRLRAIPELEVKEDRWTRRDLGNPSDPGFVLSVWLGEKDDRPWCVRTVIKSHAQPRQVQAAAWHLKRSSGNLAPELRVYSLFAAPYVSPAAANICIEEGIGYMDLAGNCHLAFGPVHIHVEGKPNVHKEERGLKSLYSPKAARLLRMLLQGPLVGHKVQELAGKTGVSLGLVSKVRRRLLDESLAEETPDGIRITRPDAVLDDWAAADRWEDRTTVREYSMLTTDPAEIASKVRGLLGAKTHAFTQWFGAYLRRPYTLPVLTTVYVEDFPDEEVLKKELSARRVDGGGRLRLVRPSDDGVFQCLQEIDGRKVVCDVQLYLDVISAGLRGDEAAEELRKAKNFSGGWK